jgi:cell division protein FtsQ
MPSLGHLLPTLRSVLVAVALLLAGASLYLAALETSLFAVRTIDVRGGTPQARAQVKQALAGELGRTLLKVNGADLGRRLAGLSELSSWRFDRAFPNTLRLTIRAEHPVLVIRRGKDAFLVSASGRVLRTLSHPRLSSLPRLWFPSAQQVAVGETLTPTGGRGAAVALASLRGVRLPSAVQLVKVGPDELTLVLATGLELRLGDPGDVRLKLAIARRVLSATEGGPTAGGYVDVSVPERPVYNPNSQVGG